MMRFCFFFLFIPFHIIAQDMRIAIQARYNLTKIESDELKLQVTALFNQTCENPEQVLFFISPEYYNFLTRWNNEPHEIDINSLQCSNDSIFLDITKLLQKKDTILQKPLNSIVGINFWLSYPYLLIKNKHLFLRFSYLYNKDNLSAEEIINSPQYIKENTQYIYAHYFIRGNYTYYEIPATDSLQLENIWRRQEE